MLIAPLDLSVLRFSFVVFHDKAIRTGIASNMYEGGIFKCPRRNQANDTHMAQNRFKEIDTFFFLNDNWVADTYRLGWSWHWQVGTGLAGPAFADLSSLQWVAVPWPATHTLQNSTQPRSVETHTYGLVKMSGKMENHRERGVIKCFTRFSSKDATSSGTWVFRVECLDLLPESFRISVSGLS